MPPEDVRDLESESGGPVSARTQKALVEAVPDLLLLLADTREQLERVRSELLEVTARAERAQQAERQLREMVAELQDDLEREGAVVASLRGEVHEARANLVESRNEVAQITEILLNTGSRAQVAEAQLEEIRASTAWRLTAPLRRLASLGQR
jgi:hypothetical protein